MRKIILALSVSLILFSCNKSNETGLKDLPASEFQSAISSDEQKQIIDVRTKGEFESGHIEGAQNMDIQSMDFPEKVAGLNKEKTVFVYCLSGGRSSTAASQLQSMGFKSIINLQGGILAWNEAQLALSKEDSKPAASGMSLASYKKLVAGKKSVIIDFHAEWCGPCKQLSPILEQFVKEQKGAVELIKIDVDQNQELAAALQIEAIPYVERYENGQLSWKKTGLFSANELK